MELLLWKNLNILYDHLEKIFCCEADINFINNLKCNEDVIIKKGNQKRKKRICMIFLYETSKGYGKRKKYAT